MIANSPSRIAKRRAGALARRRVNLKQVLAHKGIYAALSLEGQADKLGKISTEVGNLAKKGVKA
jgi:hypothetical protein